MKAIIQRVNEASVSVDQEVVSKIGTGILVLVGIGKGDTVEDVHYLSDKITSLRIFEDEKGKMDNSLHETGGEILTVPNFTLYADCSKGRRPSFGKAASPKEASKLYDSFVEELKESELNVESGVFGAYMQVELVNNGPVTLIIES